MPCRWSRATTGSKHSLPRIGLPSSVASRSVNNARRIEMPHWSWSSMKRIERTSALSTARPTCLKPVASLPGLRIKVPEEGMTKVISSWDSGKQKVKSPR
ncbi:hypothetical protein D9M71_775850 [compost metagenome]